MNTKISEINTNCSTKRTYSVKEVSEMLGISRQGVYKLIQDNLFHVVKTESGHRIIKSSFDAWLDDE